MEMRISRLKFVLVAAMFFGLAAGVMGAPRALGQDDESGLTAPLDPMPTGVTVDAIFAELLRHNAQRQAALAEYTSRRTYQVVDLKGKVHAEVIGRMDFRAPDRKAFDVSSESGSVLVRRLALHPLIASEIQTVAGKEHHESAITPNNYTLALLGEQQVGPYRCFVARAIPKRRDKYLFEGKIWIDAEDYAVVRIKGHPAKKLSFWIESADFVRQYQKLGGFWLPKRDETFVQARLYGKKALTISHQDYVVNGAKLRSDS